MSLKKYFICFIEFAFLLFEVFSVESKSKFVKQIITLETSVEKKETVFDNDLVKEIQSVKAEVFFDSLNNLFAFDVVSPEKQLLFLNNDGSFILQDSSLFKLSEDEELLFQLKNDILNWFKDDLGLSDINYKPVKIYSSDNLICTDWESFSKDGNPMVLFKTFCDRQKRIVKTQTFTYANELVAQTELTDFLFVYGNFIPQKIHSDYFMEDKLVSSVDLKFSSIKINSEQNITKAKKISGEKSNQFIPKNLDTEKAVHTVSGENKKYYTSIPKVLVLAGFTFYKKFITNQDIPGCLYCPTCSQYMLQSVQKHGVLGIVPGLERLKRCNATEAKRELYKRDENGRFIDYVE